MIEKINISNSKISFRKKQEKAVNENETRILPNTPKTRIKQGFQKTSSAFLDYPVKGLKGDINSNFYEFLTMGIVPYLLGSGMFILGFNCVNNHLSPKGRLAGKKMALGVILYGVMKTLSKHLVATPVKMATGVDTEMPYENIVYPLPKEAGEDATIEVQHQQRKVFDSKEFYRKDLLDREYFDKVAKKLGMGENLNDSVSETSPIIQNIVATSNLAKSITAYSCAALGVAIASQDSWSDFFDAISNRKRHIANGNSKFLGKIKNFGENCWNLSKSFVNNFATACKTLWKGKLEHKGFMKHCGKGLVMTVGTLVAGLTANSIIRAKNMAKNKNQKTIDRTKESTVI